MRAEALLGATVQSSYELADLQSVTHELRVHQAELEMQNEELRASHVRLTEAHDRYYELYDFAPTGYFVLDNDWRISEANNTVAALLGVTRGKLLRGRLSAYLSEAECDSFHFYLQKLQNNPDIPPFEGWFRRPNGDLLRGLLKVKARDVGFGAVLIDVTAQQLAEEQLRKKNAQLAEAANRLQQIAKAIADVFYAIDLTSDKTLFLSDAFTTIFGRGQDEGLRSASRWLAFVCPEDVPRVKQAWENLNDNERGYDLEYRISRPDGSVRLVRDRGFVDRSLNQVAGVLHDITDERALEMRLRQAQRMESLGTLAGGVAHDFNNLLMGIAGCLHLAKQRLVASHRAFAPIERALKSVMRGATLTKQLVSFGDERIQGTKVIVLDEFIVETCELLRRWVGEQVEVEVSTNAPGLYVRADPGEIEQFLMNLAGNARDAMPMGGRLTLRTGVDTRPAADTKALVTYATVTVTDTGCGMSEETRTKIFDPFFTTKDVGKGTGLGLSTVLTVVQRLNGFITVGSELGQGTTITVGLPALAKDDIAAKGLPVIEEAIKGQGETVLLVDDDTDVRHAVESYLETLNYRPLLASNANEAESLCAQHRDTIVLLISDVMMPGTLGTVLAPVLQQHYQDLPVLFISAHPSSELRRQGHVSDETRVLAKPFDIKQFAITVKEILIDRYGA